VNRVTRHPHLTARSFSQLWREAHWTTAVALYLSVFVVVWAVMWGATRLLNAAPETAMPYMGVSPETNDLLAVWQRWDAVQYQAIAERGYAAFPNALFVPPLYPGLIRLLSPLTGGNTLLAGLLIANVFGLLAAVGFQRLALGVLHQPALAQRALLYFLSFPTAFFLFAPYTESLFLAGALWYFYFAFRRRFVAAAGWGALAAMSRLTGAWLVIPALYLSWKAWRENSGLRAWLPPAGIVLGALSFPLYIWLQYHLPPWTPLTVQSSRFHGGFTLPGYSLWETLRQIMRGIYPLPNTIDLIFTLAFIVGAVMVLRSRLPRAFVIYTAAYMLLYLARVADIYPLLSMPRYVFILFPVFMVLAQWVGSSSWRHRLVLYTFWSGLFFLAGQFALWGWVA